MTKITPEIDQRKPQQLATATFAMGCFWGPDARFGVIPGIIRTRVGYAGGHTENPTYHNIGDHIETIQLDYDPTIITYQELLNYFWEGHDPTRAPYKRQYSSAIFYQNDEQYKAILQSKTDFEKSHKTARTEIMIFETFYLAENYHQKYHLQQVPELLAEYQIIYPNFQDFVNSTATARVNGYIAGYGNLENLKNEITQLGLSTPSKQTLFRLYQ